MQTRGIRSACLIETSDPGWCPRMAACKPGCFLCSLPFGLFQQPQLLNQSFQKVPPCSALLQSAYGPVIHHVASSLVQPFVPSLSTASCVAYSRRSLCKEHFLVDLQSVLSSASSSCGWGKQWVSTQFIHHLHDFLNFSCIPLSHHIPKLQSLKTKGQPF